MGDVYANGSEYENVTTKLYFKGHDLDYTADQHTDLAPELTQSGELGIPLPIESVPYKQEVINDFHTIPDIELFEKYYVDQVDNAGKVRPHSSWIGYTYTGESRHNLINKITLRVKTRESLGDKMADKAVNINSSRTSKISDLAGARIIAPNVSMAYETLGALQDLNGVHLVDTEKFGFVNDSIEDPKPNGYQDLKGFLATLEPNGMHGIVEYQVVTPKILKQNQQAKRSHQTYKFQKYNARLENIEEWNNVRSTIADLLGEENFQPLEKHELLQ
jgi:ppGpp synthetase/RelA/SpoT-type nucleotidyltranferase